ncbi:MAG: hypothetical protein OEY97_00660 [Nitrospirota bacterium]|nr:hypothetical protein [Nitrospirota bacterium]
MIRLRAILLATLLATVAVAMAPAHAQEGSAHALIEELEREVAELNARMTQVEIQESRLAAREASLEARVEALKKASPGVVRDAELQTALRDLRAALAEARNINNVEDILVTTLRTRQVALVQVSTREADRLLKRGEQAVRAGDDQSAMRDFALAFTYLRRGQGPKATSLLGHGPTTTPARLTISTEIPVTGRESPDEMRELAVILRDAAEKLKDNARTAGEELARFRDERDILRTLQQTDTGPSPSVDMVLAFLEARIESLRTELKVIRQGLSTRLAAATVLERQAAQYEAVLLNEANKASQGRK